MTDNRYHGNLDITSSPHQVGPVNTTKVMGMVLLALVPAFIVGIYQFGYRAVTLTLVCVIACVVLEYLMNKALKRTQTIGDLSAVVTGVLLAFNLPANFPYWMAVVLSLIHILLRHVDFKTVIIDDREEYANPQRYPKAARTIVVDDFDNAFDDIETDEDSYIIIVTRGHRGDLKVLRQALRRPFAYLGMIGSRRKNGLLYDALKQEGVTDEQLEQVHAPIGLEIGSETPEEIAISIVAEIISERARKNRGQ